MPLNHINCAHKKFSRPLSSYKGMYVPGTVLLSIKAEKKLIELGIKLHFNQNFSGHDSFELPAEHRALFEYLGGSPTRAGSMNLFREFD